MPPPAWPFKTARRKGGARECTAAPATAARHDEAGPPSPPPSSSASTSSFVDAPDAAAWLEEPLPATSEAGEPSTPGADYHPPPPTATDLSAHAAAWAGGVEATLAALRSLPPDARTAVDPTHGNTVLQIAAMRGHGDLVGALLAHPGLAGPPSARGARRWSALDEAALRDDAAITAALAAATVAEAKAARAAARAGLASALAAAPDFAMAVKWELGSPLFGPLLRRVAPHDTYTVWKVGHSLRIDGSLRGLAEPRPGRALPEWRRGAFSLVWHAPGSGGGGGRTSRAVAWLIDRDRNSYVDVTKERADFMKGPGGGRGGTPSASAASAARAAGSRARLRPGPLTFTPARAWHGLGPAPAERLAGGYEAAPFDVALPLASHESVRGRLDLPRSASFADYLGAAPAADTVRVAALDPLSLARQGGMPGKGRGGGQGGPPPPPPPSSARPLSARCWLAGPDFPLPGTSLAAILELAAAASPHLGPLGRFARKAADAAAAAAAGAARRGDGPPPPAEAAGGAGVAVKFQLPLLLTVHASVAILSCERLGPGDEAVEEAASWFGLPPGCRLKAASDLAAGRRVAAAAAAARAAEEEGNFVDGTPHLAALVAPRPRAESVLSSTVGDEYDSFEF